MLIGILSPEEKLLVDSSPLFTINDSLQQGKMTFFFLNLFDAYWKVIMEM